MTRQRVEHLPLERFGYRARLSSEWVKVECSQCLGAGQVFPGGFGPNVLVLCGQCLGGKQCYERVVDMKPQPIHDAYFAALAIESARIDAELDDVAADLWDAEPTEPTC